MMPFRTPMLVGAASVASFGPPAFKYIRLRAPDGPQSGSTVELTEVELRATPGGADQTTVTGAPDNTAATASSVAGTNYASAAYDNSNTNPWASATYPGTDSDPWNRYNAFDKLGFSIVVQEIQVFLRASFLTQGPTRLVLEGGDSTSGPWTTLFDKSGILWNDGISPKIFTVVPHHLAAITGTVTVGGTLTAAYVTNTVSITGATYQWRRNGSPIGGATASTYTVVSADIGQNITCEVTLTNSWGSYSDVSNTLVGDSPTWTKVGEATYTVASGTGSENKSLPGTLAQNDIVIIAIGNDGTIAPGAGGGEIATSGYTNISYGAASAAGWQVAYKIMGVTPDSSVDINQWNGRVSAVAIQVWRGVNTSTPIDGSVVEVASTGANIAIPAYTTTVDNCLRFAVGVLDDDGATSVTAPTGFGDLLWKATSNTPSGSVDATIMLASKFAPVPDYLDPDNFVTNGSDDGYAAHFALRPA